MKSVFKALYMAFGMFSVIPAPKSWDESSAKHVMSWLPVVGAVIGAIWWGAAKLLVLSDMHFALRAAILMLIPFVLSGFIHLDGYMDTSDALLSRRPAGEKQRILKDPHTGAFAVIMVALLFILKFASAYALIENGKFFVLLFIIPVLSRCCSAMTILCVKPMAKEGYAYSFRPVKAAPHRVFTVLTACSVFAMAWLFVGVPGLIVAGAVIAGYAIAMICALKGFGFRGLSGDLAGFSLTISELCGIFACGILT